MVHKEKISDAELALKVRNRMGMTQTVFGHVLGVSKRTIIRYEMGDEVLPRVMRLLFELVVSSPSLRARLARAR